MKSIHIMIILPAGKRAILSIISVISFFLLHSSQEENGRGNRQDNNRDFMEPDVCDVVGPNDNHDEIINPDDVFDSGLISTDVNRDV